MNSVNLIFPHQLFKRSHILTKNAHLYLIEEFLFFKQYKFHKQKIAFHRASMKTYEAFLKEKKHHIHYLASSDIKSDIRELIPFLKEQGIAHINYIDPVDNWLNKRIKQSCAQLGISFNCFDSPLFLNSPKTLAPYFRKDKKHYHQTSFYKAERKKRNILLQKDGKPEGGKWTFDKENRKKYPSKKTPPAILFPDLDPYYKEAKEYVENHFKDNPGTLGDQPLYPVNFKSAQKWFEQFLEHRFMEFGTYEDALVAEEMILHHSVLSPLMNVGLLTTEEVLNKSIAFAKTNKIPINSTEGFVRQILGWREFLRGIYEVHGTQERTRNFWGFTKKIPPSFYHGSTGIDPVDKTIKKVLRTGYCHHIERLMVLGNFMLLCEFDPDEVYRWFMELFIDAYDWVMVPNVYGMSQFADGGLMSTKPYISGSNYLVKMGDYKKGAWQEVWDGLFWRFMATHRNFFEEQPRLGMLMAMWDKMPSEKRASHLNNAERFLSKLRAAPDER